MKAEEIMTRNPESVSPQQTVAEAVRIMKSQDCGIVPVVDPDGTRLLGVVTDRDIALGCCDSGGEGASTAITSVMTTNLFCVDRSDSVERVRETMESAGLRRIPVVEEENRLVGIISLKDLSERLDDRTLGQTESSVLSQKPNN